MTRFIVQDGKLSVYTKFDEKNIQNFRRLFYFTVGGIKITLTLEICDTYLSIKFGVHAQCTDTHSGKKAQQRFVTNTLCSPGLKQNSLCEFQRVSNLVLTIFNCFIVTRNFSTQHCNRRF